jgi:uncharacterized SAM-binding protein YcdF (DUF218 family)
MNDWLVALGAEGLKPALKGLLMPPAPLFLALLLGAWLLARQRRVAGWLLLLPSLAGLWLMSTLAVGNALVMGLTRPPESLTPAVVASLKGQPRTAIVILGGGGRRLSPEYDSPDLTPLGQERLRYGLWLARQTGLPVLFSGGLGHGANAETTEASAAQRIAQRDFGMNIRWGEARSRDTNENARLSVALLKPEGIDQIVVVTHAFHMQRAMAAFERAARDAAADKEPGQKMKLLAAPMGFRSGDARVLTAWLPSAEGFTRSYWALHEWLGWLARA